MKAAFSEGEYRYFMRALEKLHQTDKVEEAEMYKSMIIGALEMILSRTLFDS
ncbi:hypothetical protein ACTQ1N_10985 [Porcincola sp. LCP21S3_C12]|uniref:hypothetical protein n=1 Tax=Porcincola sp. LCP21S3_C12 TaxID=3438798 RepID=UPI003F9887CD